MRTLTTFITHYNRNKGLSFVSLNKLTYTYTQIHMQAAEIVTSIV